MKAPGVMAPVAPIRERSRTCEVPFGNALNPHRGLSNAISSDHGPFIAHVAQL
jgi:hypothetical protein